MPLAGSGVILGAALAAAGLIVDGPGLSKSLSLSNAITSWLVTNSLVVNTPANPAANLLVNGSSTVTGSGRIAFIGSSNDFGDALAASIPASDTAGVAKWRALAAALYDHIKEHGRTGSVGYTASLVPGGVVINTSTLSFASSTFAPTLASVIGVAADTIGTTVWTAIGTAILLHLSTNTVVNSLGFTVPAPSGVGPLIGASTIG